MRKAFAITAIFCLLLVTSGYQLLIYLRIAEAKQQIKLQIQQSHFDSPDIIKMNFSEREVKLLSWEDDTEFEYKGEMYDVFKQESLHGTTVIWCIQDKEESTLIDGYIKTQQQSSSEKNSHPVLKLLSVQFIATQQNATAFSIQLKKKPFGYYFACFPFLEKTIITPPPRIA